MHGLMPFVLFASIFQTLPIMSEVKSGAVSLPARLHPSPSSAVLTRLPTFTPTLV